MTAMAYVSVGEGLTDWCDLFEPDDKAGSRVGGLLAPVRRVVTDWRGEALIGTELLLSDADAAPAVLERLLRTRGDTDEQCQVLVHRSAALRGSTELVYTAVPATRWRDVQAQIAAMTRASLVFDWGRVLAHLARAEGRHCPVTLALHPQGADIAICRSGTLVLLRRIPALDLATFLGSSRTALRDTLLPLLRDEAAGADAIAVQLIVLPGLEESVLQELLAELPITISRLVVPPGVVLPSRLSSMTSQDLAECVARLPVKLAVNPLLDKAESLAWRWTPLAGTATLCLALLWLAVTYVSAAGVAEEREAYQEAAAAQQRSSSTVAAQANALLARSEAQQALAVWAQQRDRARITPDMTAVLAAIRDARPDALQVESVGLVADESGHLITLVARIDGVSDTLAVEERFASALRSRRFSLRKRDVFLEDSTQKVRLQLQRLL